MNGICCMTHNAHSNEQLHYLPNLAVIRRAKGLSQWQLCLRTWKRAQQPAKPGHPTDPTITLGSIQKIERCQRPARLRTVRALAHALGVPPKALIFYDTASEARVAAMFARAAHLRAMREAAHIAPPSQAEIGTPVALARMEVLA